jgi:hypothetical protein
MKLHSPLICSQKIPSFVFFSLLDSNWFQQVASVATEGLKQSPNVIFFPKKNKNKNTAIN